LGTVGGTTKAHPTVQSNLAILGNPDARQLSGVCAAVGLAQNLGALRALTTVGIQQGHMRMHARSVAANAGAENGEVGEVVDAMVASGDFSIDNATRVIAALRNRAS
ncbi:MAG: 3-hydroxy-3-methylglutaryl-CoA reductase, partial [Rhodobacterales bacterium]|nr:3-hydroxy-3-methylglutaryl-CoA reductase [Rhodobacterales bacterium]